MVKVKPKKNYTKETIVDGIACRTDGISFKCGFVSQKKNKIPLYIIRRSLHRRRDNNWLA